MKEEVVRVRRRVAGRHPSEQTSEQVVRPALRRHPSGPHPSEQTSEKVLRPAFRRHPSGPHPSEQTSVDRDSEQRQKFEEIRVSIFWTCDTAET